MQQKELLKRLSEIRKKEITLLKEITYDLNKEKIAEKKVYKEIEAFTFIDFARIVIGCSLFTLISFIDTDVWNSLPLESMGMIVFLHIFLCICTLIALNYEYRSNVSYDPWFIRMLLKQFFYTYVSVFMTMAVIMLLVHRMTYDLTLFEITKNVIAAQSAGMLGAVAFSLLHK